MDLHLRIFFLERGLRQGLKVNLSKSCIYGVGVPHDDVNTFAHEVRCKGGTNPHDYESTNNGYRKSIVKAGMEIHNMGFHFFEAFGRKLKLHMNVVLVIDVEVKMIIINGYGIGVDPSEVEGRW
ncbi:hypothetical protein Tco_0788803 [Tanacetum coccineum]